MRLLIIAGHLDDSLLAVGGIMSKAIRDGHEVDVVCFGNSDEDFASDNERETVVEMRLKQAREAHGIIGVSAFECYNYSDYAVQENKETYRLCIQAIRKHRPDIILSHWWAEYFQHRAMARLSCDAWWQSSWPCSADLGGPWQARALYHFEVIHPLPQPTDIVDVSEVFALKMQALNILGCGYDFKRQIEARAHYLGSVIGVEYAEALEKSAYIPRAVSVIEDL